MEDLLRHIEAQRNRFTVLLEVDRPTRNTGLDGGSCDSRGGSLWFSLTSTGSTRCARIGSDA